MGTAPDSSASYSRQLRKIYIYIRVIKLSIFVSTSFIRTFEIKKSKRLHRESRMACIICSGSVSELSIVTELTEHPIESYLEHGTEHSVAVDRIFDRRAIDLLLPCHHLVHVTCLANNRNHRPRDKRDRCPSDTLLLTGSAEIRAEVYNIYIYIYIR